MLENQIPSLRSNDSIGRVIALYDVRRNYITGFQQSPKKRLAYRSRPVAGGVLTQASEYPFFMIVDLVVPISEGTSL